jgi:hypothetical protein
MSLSINAIRFSGQGAARDNLAVLLPLWATDCPGIENCQHGTINVKLEFPLQKKFADKWTQRVWNPVVALPPKRDEGFGFIQIKLECPKGAQPRDAWNSDVRGRVPNIRSFLRGDRSSASWGFRT